MITVPVNQPVLSEQAKKNVLHALETGWISSAGSFVDEFERKFSTYLGRKHGIAVSNGTTALHAALLALGVGAGDEVIVPAFTMIASIFAIMYTGARPVFVDCDRETFTMLTGDIEAKITSHTKAIMPVPIYGHACEMDEILAIAKKHHLFIIEDAAEAHGGEYKGRKCGSFGELACFSFYANKIITTGEGGMVVTDDDALAHRVRKFKDLYHSDAKRFVHEDLGYNYRITNLQAAIGAAQIDHIDEYVAQKQHMADFYGAHLRDIPGLRLPITRPHVKNVYWMYAVLVDPDVFGMNKDDLRGALKERGVDTRDFFYAPSDQPALTNRYSDMGRFPNTEYIATHGFYLPSGLALTDEQMKYVVDQIVDIKNFHS